MRDRNKKHIILSDSNSPLTETQVGWVNHLIESLTPEQFIWLNGFFTALSLQPLSEASGVMVADHNQVAAPSQLPFPITIIYGTETGNAKALATRLGQHLQEEKWEATVTDAKDYKMQKLKSERCLLIVTSTHGDGELPEPAKQWYNFLMSDRAPQCDKMHYAVLALGDSSYEHFCKCGADIDERLRSLGATSLCPRIDADIEFEKPYLSWKDALMQALRALMPGREPQTSQIAITQPEELDGYARYDQHHPFPAQVLEKINLCYKGSSKTTYHLELSLEGSRLTYKPGDCLGVHPKNNLKDVEGILSLIKYDEDQPIIVDEHDISAREALYSHLEISRVTLLVLHNLLNLDSFSLSVDTTDKEQLKNYLAGKSLLHILKEGLHSSVSCQQVVNCLRKIPPRFYSISSSLLARPEEVHLLVTMAHIDGPDGQRLGMFSDNVHHMGIGDFLPVYIHENSQFRLNYESMDKPIIMIGPGTGLAPFRAFMEEREEMGFTGPSWLFFGECNMFTDFYYQTEWLKRLENKSLTRMNAAFSRDQSHKVYVQHRMKEEQKELFDWIDSQEATLCVCGDAKKMAKDVHLMLIEIISIQKNCSQERAMEYLDELAIKNRYLRDVY